MNTTLLAFSLGPWEIGLLLIIMVFVFGPRRFPEIGKSLGEGITSFKKATRTDDDDKQLTDSAEKPE